jgi:hypothetical protein
MSVARANAAKPANKSDELSGRVSDSDGKLRDMRVADSLPANAYINGTDDIYQWNR